MLKIKKFVSQLDQSMAWQHASTLAYGLQIVCHPDFIGLNVHFHKFCWIVGLEIWDLKVGGVSNDR